MRENIKKVMVILCWLLSLRSNFSIAFGFSDIVPSSNVARRGGRKNRLTKKSVVWHTCYILLNNDRKRDKQEKAIKGIQGDRQALIFSAVLDKEFEDQIEFEGTSDQF